MLYASSTLSLACLEVLVHIRDSGLVPYDYMFCEIEVPDVLIAPWRLTGKVATARIESEVLSREWGDAWLKGREQMLNPQPATQGITIPAQRVSQIQAVPSSVTRIPLSPEEPRFRFTPFLR